ncbi:MAG: type II toxin-antitoxin system HicB family antitoxin [Verrucomicrobiota bacterium]|jgi:predicted RNase H-like HicB family nuclease
MILQYIEKALSLAHYEIIDDEDPYYGEVPGLDGVLASGKTLEDCRYQLAQVVEDWILYSIANKLPINSLEGITVKVPEMVAND